MILSTCTDHSESPTSSNPQVAKDTEQIHLVRTWSEKEEIRQELAEQPPNREGLGIPYLEKFWDSLKLAVSS